MKTIRILMAAAAMALAGGCAEADGPVTASKPAPKPEATQSRAFLDWRNEFRTRALASGVEAAVFDRAFRGVSVNDTVLERDAYQPEFTRAIWEYLDSAVSETRIANGRAEASRKVAALAEIERRFGVDGEVVLAIWGLESAYGANYGDIPVIESLATLAFDGRRRDFAEEQLVAALKIIQAGDIAPERMVGSWAGAMGHTQFIPTSFLAYAADYDGDGRRDIWAADALDALASTANYLSRFGWRAGEPWGVEAATPANFDYALAGQSETRPVEFWRARGVTLPGGGPLPDHGPASLIAPAGAAGPKFLVFRNFSVIKRYNNATSYALAVGHLADRIAGKGPFVASWPRGDKPLSRRQTEELQTLLTRLGYDTGGADGLLGPNTQAAIKAWQKSRGEPQDGYASAAMLNELRRQVGG